MLPEKSYWYEFLMYFIYSTKINVVNKCFFSIWRSYCCLKSEDRTVWKSFFQWTVKNVQRHRKTSKFYSIRGKIVREKKFAFLTTRVRVVPCSGTEQKTKRILTACIDLVSNGNNRINGTFVYLSSSKSNRSRRASLVIVWLQHAPKVRAVNYNSQRSYGRNIRMPVRTCHIHHFLQSLSWKCDSRFNEKRAGRDCVTWTRKKLKFL